MIGQLGHQIDELSDLALAARDHDERRPAAGLYNADPDRRLGQFDVVDLLALQAVALEKQPLGVLNGLK